MTNVHDTEGSALGSAEETADEWEVRFVRDLSHPPAAVWAALTDPDEARRWWAEVRIDPRVGGELAVRWLNGPDGSPREWTTGEITALEPEVLLEHGNSDHGLLRWELHPTPGGTRLTLVDRLLPDSRRWVTSSLAGWHLHLDHLRGALDGESVDWPAWHVEHEPQWAEIRAVYRAQTGLE